MRKKGLGRGLSELISGEALARSRAVLEVSLDNLEPNPYQPRSEMNEDSLEELTLSIETHGVVQPVVVRKTDEEDVFQIVAGERRWRAAGRAGLNTIPCIITEADDERMLELALVENLQRDDLGPIETAHALRHLIDEFGLTQEQVAEQLGRSRSAVANMLRLLDLPGNIKEALASGSITQGHARALLALGSDPERMQEVFRAIQEEDLTVRATEDRVRRGPDPEPEPPHEADSDPEAEGEGTAAPAPASDPHVEDVKRRLRDRLGTKVTVLSRPSGGGSIHISYHDNEDLDRIISLIVPAGPRSYTRVRD